MIVGLAMLAPWISPYDPQAMLDPVHLRSQAMSWAHPMGTDPYSRDVLSRMLSGARVSLGLALSTVVVATVFGTMLGAISGYAGGRLDRLAMRLTDTMLAIPRVLVLLTVVGCWGAPTLPLLMLLLAATGWMDIARIVRGEVRARCANDAIAAARALGVGHWRVLWRHLLPHVVPVIAVSATLGVGQLLLLESGLSFLGVGVPAPIASWGTVLLDVSDVIGPSRWLLLGPGLVLVVTVTALHRLGDGLRRHVEAPRAA
jgi:peptide/nickel transport system permease protein